MSCGGAADYWTLTLVLVQVRLGILGTLELKEFQFSFKQFNFYSSAHNHQLALVTFGQGAVPRFLNSLTFLLLIRTFSHTDKTRCQIVYLRNQRRTLEEKIADLFFVWSG